MKKTYCEERVEVEGDEPSYLQLGRELMHVQQQEVKLETKAENKRVFTLVGTGGGVVSWADAKKFTVLNVDAYLKQ